MKKMSVENLAKETDSAIGSNNLIQLNVCKNELLNSIKSGQLSIEEKSRAHYFLANIHLFRYDNNSKMNANKLLDKKEAINNFLLAIHNTKNPNYLWSYYTNLGNLFKAESRYLEAIDWYQKAQIITQNKALLPIGNKLESLYEITKDMFVFGQQEYLFRVRELWRVTLLDLKKIKINKYRDEEIEQNRGRDIIASYIKDFDNYFNDYKKNYDAFHAKKSLTWSIQDPFLKDSKKSLSNRYRTWCLKERLLLNVLNLVKHPDTFHDELLPRKISVNEGDFIFTMWQQLAQEYCSARYTFFVYKDLEDFPNKKHFSDKGNDFSKLGKFGKTSFLTKGKKDIVITVPYEDLNHCFSYEVEELKSAYTKLYGILNKITVLLFSYIKLIKDCDAPYLKTIQENTDIKDGKIELHTFLKICKDIDIIKQNNSFLYSFISIYEDVCGNNVCDEFKKIKEIRDVIAHGYIKVSYYDGGDFFNYSYNSTIKANYLKISLHEFKRNFEKLLLLVKNSFFYADLCIASIEKTISKPNE